MTNCSKANLRCTKLHLATSVIVVIITGGKAYLTPSGTSENKIGGKVLR